MKKTVYENPMSYEYNAERRGAKYNINGKWANHGEFLESVAKCHRGLDYIINPNTSYDTGSDIESEQASVKSSGATLACIFGNSKEEILQEYFEKVASTKWIWIVNVDEEITEYEMNRKEFKEFAEEWSQLVLESSKTKRRKVRFKTASGKMIQWFEERVV